MWRGRREEQLARMRTFLEQHNMDALIVAVKQHPTPIVLGLVDFLAPSRPIAIHCMYKEVSRRPIAIHCMYKELCGPSL